MMGYTRNSIVSSESFETGRRAPGRYEQPPRGQSRKLMGVSDAIWRMDARPQPSHLPRQYRPIIRSGTRTGFPASERN